MGRTFLCVDDDPAILEALHAVFRARGDQVLLAGGAEEALGILSHFGRPDLLLTDLNMPGVDGATLIARVREMPELAGLPILVFSAETEAPRVSPPYRFLSKPVRLKELMGAIDELLAFSSSSSSRK